MKRFILILMILMIAIGFSSCSWIKNYAIGKEEDEKPAGYIESKENDLFGYDVFRNHIAITSYIGEETAVIVPDTIDGKTVTTIAEIAFYNSTAESITLPQTITTIESSAFYYCGKLTEMDIPDSVTVIGERAFAWCTSLESIRLPKNLTEIPDYTFNYCTSLQEIKIPDKVTKIGLRSFSWCSSLTKIELPSSVVTIGDNAFLNCNSLLYAIIPDNANSFGKNIFKNCDLLTVITSEGSACYLYCIENEYSMSFERPIDESSDETSAESK